MMLHQVFSIAVVVVLAPSLVAVPAQGASIGFGIEEPIFGNLVQTDESLLMNGAQCKGLPSGFEDLNVGCTNGISVLADAVRALTSAAAGDSEIGNTVGDVLNPMLTFVEDTINGETVKMGKTVAVLKSSVCFGEFLGSDVKAKTPAMLGKHGCSTIPLKSQENYLIVSVEVPTDPFMTKCPGDVKPGVKMSMCIAFALCDDLPTLAFVANAPLISCAMGSGAVSASSGGSSKALGQAVKVGLNMVGFGFSLGADLEYSTTVWDGDAMVAASVKGNYYDYVEVNFDPMTKALGLPEIFRINGHQMRVVSILGDAKDSAKMLAGSEDSSDAIGESIKNFAAVAKLYVSISIQFEKISKGALPPLPKLEVGSFAAVMSNQPKSETNVPQGFYATAQGADTVSALIKQLITYMTDNLGGVVDAIFGDGAMDGFADAIAPKPGPSTNLAFAATRKQVGFFLEAPLSPISIGPFSGPDMGALAFSCKVRVADGHFSCEIDYKFPKFFTAFLDGAVYLAKAALKFFDETGKVIAAVATKAAGEAVKWTKGAIEDTAEAIEDGLIIVGETAKEWADETVKAIDQTFDKIDELADKGLDTLDKGLDSLGDAGEPVKAVIKPLTDIIDLAPKPKDIVKIVTKPQDVIKIVTKPKEIVKAVVPKFNCAMTRFKNGRCGPQKLLNCGTQQVTSSYHCGTKTAASTYRCGKTAVTSVAKCGWSFLKNLCSGCSGCSGCGWGGCSGCSGCSGCFKKRKAARCNISATCSWSLSCLIPKKCWKDTYCTLPFDSRC